MMLSNYEYITKQSDIPLIVTEAEKYKEFCVDTETTGLDFTKLILLLLQLEINGKAYLIDARKVDVEPLRDIFESRYYQKTIQNAKFDYKVMWTQRRIPIRGIFDTYIAEMLLQAGNRTKESNLGALAKYYCDITLKKDIVTSFIDFNDKEFSKSQLDYAAADVLVLPKIKRLQENYLKQYNMLGTAALEFALVEPISQMELAGILLDADKWRSSLASTKKKLFSLKASLREILPDPAAPEPKPVRYKKDGTLFKADQEKIDNPKAPPVLNIDSWQQVLWSFEEVGIDLAHVDRRTHAGKTNARTLKAAISYYSNDPEKVSVLRNFIKYRGLKQIDKTFGENLIQHIRSDNRIHAEFHQNGTDSGRFSSSNPNLQNIQKKGEEGKILRSCFIPKAGCKFVIADYSQIELRIAAELSGDPTMLAILSDPKGDIHKATASEMYKVPYDEVTPAQRNAAKTLNFGIIYGMTIKTLSERLGVEYEEAASALEKYVKTYPILMSWIEAEGEAALKRGFSKTIGGRVRWFPSLQGMDERTKAFYTRVGRNHPIQGTSADMIKIAIVLLFEPLLLLWSITNNTVHDELCVETPEEYAIDVARLIKRKMIAAGKKYVKRIPVLVDVKIRDCWWKDDGVDDNENCQQLWLVPPSCVDNGVEEEEESFVNL